MRMSIFYQKMKEIRKDADKSQQDIAEYLNITRQQYQLYESGKRYIPVDLLTEFCKFFHVSSDYILGLEPDLEWPRMPKRKGESGDIINCTKYIFLYVNFLINKKTYFRPFSNRYSHHSTPLTENRYRDKRGTAAPCRLGKRDNTAHRKMEILYT